MATWMGMKVCQNIRKSARKNQYLDKGRYNTVFPQSVQLKLRTCMHSNVKPFNVISKTNLKCAGVVCRCTWGYYTTSVPFITLEEYACEISFLFSLPLPLICLPVDDLAWTTPRPQSPGLWGGGRVSALLRVSVSVHPSTSRSTWDRPYFS